MVYTQRIHCIGIILYNMVRWALFSLALSSVRLSLTFFYFFLFSTADKYIYSGLDYEKKNNVIKTFTTGDSLTRFCGMFFGVIR
jgi:hypothetical protein